MEDLNVIDTIVNTGTSVVFLWLYLRERARVKEVTERHIADLREHIARRKNGTLQ
jgi:hypothetical protein